jgi:hypothetical protein
MTPGRQGTLSTFFSLPTLVPKQAGLVPEQKPCVLHPAWVMWFRRLPLQVSQLGLQSVHCPCLGGIGGAWDWLAMALFPLAQW